MTKEYSKFVSQKIKPPEDIKLSVSQRNLIHMAMGVATEAGELLSSVKASTIYEKELDLENVLEELGDLEFYMEGLRQQLGLTREEIVAENMRKLSARYHSGRFSNDQAQNRADKQ